MLFNSSARLSLRALKRDKTYSLVNIIGLSLGLVSCAFVFLYAYHTLTYDHYHPDYKQIYRVNSTWVGTEEKRSMAITAPAVGFELTSNFSFVENAAIISAMNSRKTLTVGESNFEMKHFRSASPGVLDVFHFNLLSGTKTETGIYLDDSWALKLFGNIDCVGKVVTIGDKEHIVSGVFERWPQNVDLRLEGLLMTELDQSDWEQFGFMTYTNSNTGFAPLQNALTEISERLYFGEEYGNDHILLEAQSLDGLHFAKSILGDLPKGNITFTYLALATGIILVIVILINIANLSTIRAVDAIRMNGIRKILGASQKQILLYQLVQLLTLYCISLIIAATLFQVLSGYFAELTGIIVVPTEHLGLLLAFAFIFLLLILGTGLLVDRLSLQIKAVHALKNHVSSQLPGSRLRKIMVVFQFIITGLVISCLLVLTLQWRYIKNKDLGFNTENVAVISLLNGEVNAHVLKNELVSLMGADNVSLGTWGTIPGGDVSFTTATLPHSNIDNPVNIVTYDENFLKVFNIKVREGTVPSKNVMEERLTQPVLINQTLARLIENPIDEQITVTWFTASVQGIIEDYNYQSLHNVIQPLIMIPQGERYENYTHIFIKTPLSKVQEVESILTNELTPSDYTFQMMDDHLLSKYNEEQKSISLFIYFSLICLLIAILGILGVVTYTLKKREYEIGIRKILGAQMKHLYVLFANEMLVLLTVSGIICIPLAIYLKERILQIYAFQVTFNWWYFFLPMFLIVITAMALVIFKINSTGKVNPVNLLRED